jgi:hypothetical protein
MRLKQLVYRKKFNLGNYETQDIELTAELFDTDDINEVFSKLKKKILELGKGE